MPFMKRTLITSACVVEIFAQLVHVHAAWGNLEYLHGDSLVSLGGFAALGGARGFATAPARVLFGTGRGGESQPRAAAASLVLPGGLERPLLGVGAEVLGAPVVAAASAGWCVVPAAIGVPAAATGVPAAAAAAAAAEACGAVAAAATCESAATAPAAETSAAAPAAAASAAAASSVLVVGGGRGAADEFAVLVADEAALGLGLLLRHGSRDDRGFTLAAGGHDVRAAEEPRAGRDRGGAPRAERRVAGLAHPGRR